MEKNKLSIFLNGFIRLQLVIQILIRFIKMLLHFFNVIVYRRKCFPINNLVMGDMISIKFKLMQIIFENFRKELNKNFIP